MPDPQDEPHGTADLVIEMLPAAYGDCLLVTAAGNPEPFTMLIDSGPSKATLAMLRRRLAELPQVGGRRRIDLFVITHIDGDHIGNAAALLRDRELGLEFADVWFNGHAEVLAAGQRGTDQADEVSQVLQEQALPQNVAFAGGPVMVPAGDRPWLPVDLGPGRPRLTLLSPRPKQLQRLARVWPDAVSRAAAGEPDSPSADLDVHRGKRLDRPAIALGPLAEVPYEEDDSLPNASSIAFLLEHRGHSVLLTGDGISSVYGPAVAALLASRPAGQRGLDVVKLSHHGSRRNNQRELALTRPTHYLVSSDNGRYGLPDDETLARLLAGTGNGQHPTFWFNYATGLNLRWEAVAAEHGGFSVRYPAGATADRPAGDGRGIVLRLG